MRILIKWKKKIITDFENTYKNSSLNKELKFRKDFFRWKKN